MVYLRVLGSGKRMEILQKVGRGTGILDALPCNSTMSKHLMFSAAFACSELLPESFLHSQKTGAVHWGSAGPKSER